MYWRSNTKYIENFFCLDLRPKSGPNLGQIRVRKTANKKKSQKKKYKAKARRLKCRFFFRARGANKTNCKKTRKFRNAPAPTHRTKFLKKLFGKSSCQKFSKLASQASSSLPQGAEGNLRKVLGRRARGKNSQQAPENLQRFGLQLQGSWQGPYTFEKFWGTGFAAGGFAKSQG